MSEATARFVGKHRWRIAALVAVVVFALSCAAVVIRPELRGVSILFAAASLLGFFVIVALSARDHNNEIKKQDLKLDVALNNMSQGLCMFDDAARLVLCNPRYLQIYGLSPDIIRPGCTLRELILHRKATGTFSGDPDAYVAGVLENYRNGTTTETVVELDDGRVINLVNTPISGGGWVATHDDVTGMRRGEKELARTRRFLDLVIDNVPSAIIVKDARDLRYVLINREGEDIYGLPREQMIGKTVDEIFPEKSNSFITMRDRQVLESRKPKVFGEHPYDSPHKGLRIHVSRRVPVLDEAGEPQYMLSVIQDVTEHKQAEARIAHMAHHDPLTDLPNRAAFQEHFAATLERCAKAGETFAVLCIDFDRFKEINDVFGHSMGDAVLRAVARRLGEVANEAFLARLGGDEFAIIVAGDSLPTSAAQLADRLLEVVDEDFDIEGHRLRIGISIGIAVYPGDGADQASLLANADAALYRAKAEGRGSIRFFEAEMDQQLRERRALTHDLRSAIARGELALHYQPQARIDGEIVGFEALVRWRHPIHGPIPPAIFIPLAEESGLILEMGAWIMRTAGAEAAAWPKPLRIAVNVSLVQFQHGDLVALVHTMLLETGLSASRLDIEITESVLIDDFSRAVSILRRLRALGVHIAMDDFGTGYSSLQNLQSFRFDKLKIDRSFISNLDTNPQSQTIVRAVIGLGRGLDVPIVAEGVETRKQLRFLSTEACDEVQGFLVGRPLPIEAYAAVVGRNPVPKKRKKAAA